MKKKHSASYISIMLFAPASLFMGLYGGLYDPSFNNYLDQVHHVSAQVRGGLEFPRELPGFLVVFIFTALAFMADTRLAALSACFIGVALWGQAWLSPDIQSAVIWMFLWSIGAHLYMGLSHAIALRLASAGGEGKLLGRIGAIESLGALLGMVLLYAVVHFFSLGFSAIFGLAGLFALIGAVLLYSVNPGHLDRPQRKLVLKKKYTLFYYLNILFGARKQVFITFAPWLLIKHFDCGVETFALLAFIGTVASLFFRPALGKAIDYWGERNVISLESGLLIIMCLAYGICPVIMSKSAAEIVVMFCYIMDQLLFSVRMARSTYLYRIAETPSDVPATLSMGLTLDHAVSMLIPLGGGLVWAAWGYEYVFLFAALIALANLAAARRIPRFGQYCQGNNPPV